jgi:4-hydroxy-tetrahydrodipicolinate synthase
MAAGGDGVISVTSNAAPKLMALLVEYCRAGAIDQARTVQERLLPWMSAAFLESNPIPAKAALASMGKIENVLRLPLVPLDPRHDAALREALWICGAL